MNTNITLAPPVSYLVNEIRNPLCNIYLACDMLKQADLDEEQRICLGIISRGSDRINDLVSDILSSPAAGETDNGKGL